MTTKMRSWIAMIVATVMVMVLMMSAVGAAGAVHATSEKASDDAPPPTTTTTTTTTSMMTISIIVALIAVGGSATAYALGVFGSLSTTSVSMAFGGKGDTLLLLGPVGAGKTTLYFQLKQGRFRATQSSMKENVDRFVPAGCGDNDSSQKTALRVVDLPGHSSQRHKLPSFIATALGIVYVLPPASSFVSSGASASEHSSDTSNISSNNNNNSNNNTAGDNSGVKPTSLLDVSNDLFQLLSDPTLVQRKVPLCLAFNRRGEDASDSSLTSDEEKIVAQMEQLLERARHLQSSMPDLQGDSASGAETVLRIGREGTVFTFDQSTVPVTVTACNVAVASGGIEPIVQFVRAL